MQDKLVANNVWLQRTCMLTIHHLYLVDQGEDAKVKDLVDLVRRAVRIHVESQTLLLLVWNKSPGTVLQTNTNVAYMCFIQRFNIFRDILCPELIVMVFVKIYAFYVYFAQRRAYISDSSKRRDVFTMLQ